MYLGYEECIVRLWLAIIVYFCPVRNGENAQRHKKGNGNCPLPFCLQVEKPYYLRRRYIAKPKANAPKIAAYVEGSGTADVPVSVILKYDALQLVPIPPESSSGINALSTEIMNVK